MRWWDEVGLSKRNVSPSWDGQGRICHCLSGIAAAGVQDRISRESTAFTLGLTEMERGTIVT